MMFISLSLILSLTLLFLLVSKSRRVLGVTHDHFPRISILIAARNEEEFLPNCLNALVKQDYPKDKLEILIGDDSSKDNTDLVIQEYQKNYDYIKYKLIDKKIGVAKGKANVLAHLAREASGSYFLITDADIQVNSNWCMNMVNLAMNSRSDIVTGVTTIRNLGVFSRLQNIDWIYSLALVKSVTDLKLPVTAMGNNMLVSKKAYLETGGYEKIPFSVTEDFALFNSIIKNGGDFHNDFSKDTLAISEPINSVLNLLKQRKRWMKGALKTPWYMVFILFMQALFYPMLIISAVYSPINTLLCFTLKYVIQSCFILWFSKKIKIKLTIIDLLFYEIYSGLLSTSLIFYYLISTGVKWKGREF